MNKDIKSIQHSNRFIRFIDPPAIGSAEQWLNAKFWQEQKAVIGESKGRNTVWFVTDGCREFVLRHYYRGGLPAKIIGDQFIYTGMEKTRSMAEFNLLLLMIEQGLPVPKPVVADVERSGLTYRASILIERISEARDLFQQLCEQPLLTDDWERIGAMIRQFHDAGVYHSDLNCRNILWQDGENGSKPWLIDFDRCEIRQNGAWRAANIARLKRSLEKERALHQDFNWQESDWRALLSGYERE